MITVEKVEEAYEKLIYTTNNEEREKMNVFLTQFQVNIIYLIFIGT